MNKGIAVVTGASSGLGKAIQEAIRANYIVFDWSLETGVNVTDAASIQEAATKLPKKIDLLINCAGVNYIEFLPELQEADWDRVIDTNLKSIFLVSKALLERLRGGTIVNIVSNASHMPMTSSLAYNASKGGAAIATRQMARELNKTHGITVFGISPNKLKNTGMSDYVDNRVLELRGWTKEQALANQLAALPAGEETDPGTCAEFIAFLLSNRRRHVFLNGCDIPYGA